MYSAVSIVQVSRLTRVRHLHLFYSAIDTCSSLKFLAVLADFKVLCGEELCLRRGIAAVRIVVSIHVHTHTPVQKGGGGRLCLLVAAMPAFVRTFVGFALLSVQFSCCDN